MRMMWRCPEEPKNALIVSAILFLASICLCRISALLKAVQQAQKSPASGQMQGWKAAGKREGGGGEPAEGAKKPGSAAVGVVGALVVAIGDAITIAVPVAAAVIPAVATLLPHGLAVHIAGA